MSFLFRKNGSSSRRRIKDKLRGRNSDRGKREEEARYDGGSDSDSLPPPPSPWGFLFPDDFVRIDGNLKAVIVDEEGLDVIYWKKLIELDNSGKIRKNPKPRRRGDKSDAGFIRTGADQDEDDDDDDEVEEDESIEEVFSFHVKKSQIPLSSSGGEIRDQSNDNGEGARYYTSSSSTSTSAASPSRTSYSTGGTSDYGAVGKQSQSKFQAPGGSFPSSPSHFQSGGGAPSPPLPLPPGQLTAATGSFTAPGAVNQTLPQSSLVPLPQGQLAAATGPFAPPMTVNQTVPQSPPVSLPPGQFTATTGTFVPSLTGNQTVPQPPLVPLPPGHYITANAPPPPPPAPATVAPPPPPPAPATVAPPPPPPPKKAAAPPPPPPPGKKGPGPPPPKSKTGPPKLPGKKGPESSSAIDKTEDPTKPKLKPLHWDKMNPDASHSMVWHRIDGGSFNFDGDLMEALFGYVGARKPSEANNVPQNPTVSTPQTYILDPRKSQNKAIVLKSLGMTKEEIIDLLTEGYDAEPDTLEKLAGIAPTPEEQSEILEFDGDPAKLADAESLLFHILRAVPSAFNRFNVMLFKINYGSEVAQQKASLLTLESACNELRSRGLFMKLLEVILKAGNRMNAGTARGNAQAFNLTALRKLSDVKSVDGKTTLLHFVVEEVVRSEGKRAAMNKNMMPNSNASGENADASREQQEIEFIKLGLPIIGGLSSEFTSVKKAAGIDYDSFVATTLSLSTRVKETKRLLDQSKGKEDECLTKLRSFFESAEEELRVIITEEQTRIMELVKRTTNYYQARALKERNLFQLFVIIRDFLGMVDNACSEIARNQRKQRPVTTVAAAGASTSTEATPSTAATPQRNAVRFPILPPNFMSESSRYSSSDSDSDS